MPRPTILGGPSKETLNILTEAIERCATYRAIAGLVIFSGGDGPVLDAHSLATRLFGKRALSSRNTSEAVDWLIRLMTTRETTGLFKAAVWGLSIDRDVALAETSWLMPFAVLPDSYMRRKIVERIRRCYDGSVWMTQNYFDAPSAAFVEQVRGFPYIREDNAAFLKMDELIWKAHEFFILAQAACIGHPLAVACWFEYADSELEYAEWENDCTWLLPEIPPHVKRLISVDVDDIQASVAGYYLLPEEQRGRLFRSMERFRLSQSRREAVDRVLDLALAFEIAVSERGDNAPPGWKVSVRSAQMIGGPLAARQQTREKIGALYELRNQAAHGATLKTKSAKTSVDEVLQESCDLYVALVKRLLSLREKPDWKSIELGGK
ncbi:HEPN domain-containing protein [Bradyrhizobium sp. sBnM-33]|uniref:HEPN domain-containing protein n=1 Tax=Bradyrhizobium sp. sBnM-33 TaxID=2831780 RepID=UPI001BCD48FF|nr:HEPN domain-containing protein [Bradyrhizobium sp. sBnM-33]WOH53101.1 HEPN domain-containing protein [Bradyrhizobium sp. sBnM-33]